MYHFCVYVWDGETFYFFICNCTIFNSVVEITTGRTVRQDRQYLKGFLKVAS